MRKLVILTALAASSAIAAPAFAQDFSGPRAEVVAGLDSSRVHADGASGSKDGFLYGGAIGYDYQAGRAVFGIDGEVTGATTRTTANDVLVAGDSVRTKAGRDFYIGGRVGAVVAPSTLLYAKAGYTNARVNTRYTAGTTTVEDGENLDGYRVGAGVEVKLNPKAYVKAEYRYSDYGHLDGNYGKIDRHQVLAGVGYRF